MFHRQIMGMESGVNNDIFIVLHVLVSSEKVINVFFRTEDLSETCGSEDSPDRTIYFHRCGKTSIFSLSVV